jgi:Family of unknown function (DUF5343)
MLPARLARLRHFSLISVPVLYLVQYYCTERVTVMALFEEVALGYAPYASSDNVLAVIRKRREGGLPEVLDIEELSKAGVPKGLETRTLRALRYLGLIDDAGRQKPMFGELARASAADYPLVLGDLIRRAYKEVFAAIGEPSQALPSDFEDAFRKYSPDRQRHRMISLFTSLCREAGLMSGSPSYRSGSRLQGRLRNESRSRATDPGGRQGSGRRSEMQADSRASATGLDYRETMIFLASKLPPSGEWTEARKAKWLEMVRATIDFEIAVVVEEASN